MIEAARLLAPLINLPAPAEMQAKARKPARQPRARPAARRASKVPPFDGRLPVRSWLLEKLRTGTQPFKRPELVRAAVNDIGAGYSDPSVYTALNKLAKEKLVRIDGNGEIFLLAAGRNLEGGDNLRTMEEPMNDKTQAIQLRIAEALERIPVQLEAQQWANHVIDPGRGAPPVSDDAIITFTALGAEGNPKRPGTRSLRPLRGVWEPPITVGLYLANVAKIPTAANGTHRTDAGHTPSSGTSTISTSSSANSEGGDN